MHIGNSKHGKKEYKGYIQIVAAGAMWGTIGPFVMSMSHYGSTSLLTSFIRVFFAFFIMAGITIGKEGACSFRISKRALLSCALLGFVCQGFYNIFYSLAVVMTGVTISAVLLNIAPLFTAIMAGLFFSEQITGSKVIALCVNVIGCILAVTGGKFNGISFSIIGVLYGVGAGLCYAMTAIFGRIAGNRCSAYVMSSYSYFFAAVFLAIFTKPWEIRNLISGELLIVGFLYALIPTAIGYLLYYKGVQKISETSKVPVLASVETVVAAALGMIVYREQLGILNIFGIVLVLFSIGIMNRKNRRGN